LLRLLLAPVDHEFQNSRSPTLKYIFSPFALIDLLSIAPFYLHAFLPLDLRMLRFLRLLRILKLFRVVIPAYHDFVERNRGRTFRQKIHALVFPSDYGGDLHHHFDNFIVFWVVVSVMQVVLESVESIEYVLATEFLILDAVAVGIFSVEYLLRLYACVEDPRFAGRFSGRVKHVTSFGALIDFLAILPFFLEVFLHHLFDLRFLRVFRLMRLLKLTRYTGATQTLVTVVKREWPIMAASAFIMLLLVLLTASLGYLFEHQAQPDKFENIPQSIYWAVITLASVGYGDISPVTPVGRALTIVLALLGIGIFAIPAALLSSAFSDQLRIDRENLVNQLYEMLADGHLDDEEHEILHREAKRLHLTEKEVQNLIDRARRQREVMDDLSQLPLHLIAKNPAHAVEHYKSLLGQMRQLAILTDPQSFEAEAVQKNRLTDTDWLAWKLISGRLSA
jgi:voltage-gated potassium channel